MPRLIWIFANCFICRLAIAHAYVMLLYYPGSEGLIEDVILLGAPVSGDAKAWMPFSKILSGKIVNGYSRYTFALHLQACAINCNFNGCKNELRHLKTGFLHMRKQRRRSASR